MFCSVIIPTIGRSSLARAVHSVLDQIKARNDCELIIVNDSGQPLAEESWQSADSLLSITTQRRERSIARNTGAALAKGEYFYFLDDDDWLLPGALDAFQTLASQSPTSVWLCGGIRIVDEATKRVLAEIYPELTGNSFAQVMGGAWAPIQSSLIQGRAFFDTGGFDPSITGTEDLDLCRRIALRGNFACTTSLVSCLLRGSTWKSSTDYLRAPEDTLRSRDQLLNEGGSLTRLLVSADSPYWYGRLLRVYLSTALWHLRHKRITCSLSRTLYSALCIVAARSRVCTWEYWRGVRDQHAPDTLHHVMRAYEFGRLDTDKAVADDNSLSEIEDRRAGASKSA